MKRLPILCVALFSMLGAACDDAAGAGSGGATSASDGSSGSSTGTGMASAACVASAAEITELPSCAANTATPVAVKAGCTPTFDGTLHADEWSDGTCFFAGDLTIVVKYGTDGLYLAASGAPTCNCPMGFVFDPDHAASPSGDEFVLALRDDPTGKDGDRHDFVLMGGGFVAGAAPAGIVTACPGMKPTPVRYEVKLPWAAIGGPNGAPHDLGFALYHANAHWPKGLVLDAMNAPTDPKSYGVLSLE